MLYGVLIGDNRVMLTDASHGKPIVAFDETEPPVGYHNEARWTDAGTHLVCAYDLAPDEGTPEQAALALSRMQFQSLPDDAAVELRALAPEWIAGQTYTAGLRYLYKGELYKCLQTHVAQADWAPDAAPSLWAKVLSGQSGEVGEWEQPDASNGYSIGDRVTHNGHLWESTQDDNVWEPGATGAPWTDLGEVAEG